MTDGLKGKVVLVTGGASGLGRMIVESLLSDGARVIITSRRRAADVAAELDQHGRCIGVNTELTADGALERLAEVVRGHSSSLHAVINNAGRTWGAPIDRFPDSAWRDVLDLNVRVPFAIVQRLLPLLESAASADDPARVINIGSVAGTTVQGLSAFSYSASKAALHHLSRELAATLASRHITVNTIVPGFFETKMTAHIRGDEEASGQVRRSIPLGRFGRAEDIGPVARFLLSPGANYITGAEIPVDGGLCGCR